MEDLIEIVGEIHDESDSDGEKVVEESKVFTSYRAASS
jgi:CBS domain containing-hemolysin-like protein